MAKPIFNKEQQDILVNAIKQAELNTSGEIMLHVDKNCKGDVLINAKNQFNKLGVNKTELSNGVLFYIAVKDKKFAILGDKGIDAVTPDNFWEEIKSTMLEEFKNDQLINGLKSGIIMAGEALKKHFPYQSDDINELNDEISFGS